MIVSLVNPLSKNKNLIFICCYVFDIRFENALATKGKRNNNRREHRKTSKSS